ncbi:LysR family transcriptional regulator [Cellvibrio zantedeschiae]|uniref:LysR family transcriptional regulator n=1 Tax=Cellvibrio zantedeschiae TaxID=1237077 RepID=A0ABQ3B7P7_9GAMM|nr:LysR family transcriptional regulator [Cellvibrio zantedeschiae]GGY83243.1 LysR family transcriptional regulator [Cellvibrio zantedeschiae]
MDRYTELQVFVAVAESEGFAVGARKLGISPPVATRAVADLEARLGIKLLTRSTRHVRVTDAGKRYLDDAKRILLDIAEADEAATGINGEPSGHLAVTAPVLFGKMFVLPGVIEFLNRYPKMEVNALFLDRVVNLLEEGLDVGIRIGDLADSSMRAIRVGAVKRIVCASPEYIKRAGTPQHPDELLQHTIITANGLNASTEWKFKDGINIRVKPRLSFATNDAAMEAAIAGFGITRLLSYQIAPQLADGRLNVLLADFEQTKIPIHVIHREGRYASAKIRSFVDLMVEQLRNNPSLNSEA